MSEPEIPTLTAWSLCIATLNRQDVLLQALGHAMTQSHPPAQIVIVDASDNWRDSRARVQQMLEAHPQIALDYMTTPVRSSATQRNLGITRCSEDIVFVTDDDSFMHPTCAEEIMRLFAADTDHQVAGIAATLVDKVPATANIDALAQKDSGVARGPSLQDKVMQTGTGRWIAREILFQSATHLFMMYDEPRTRRLPEALKDADANPVVFLPGSAMAFRRAVALKEPFDTSLRYYAAFEDLDASYRYARHGALLRAHRAHLHHFEAASGRIKRKKVIVFQLLNTIIFLKRHAKDPAAWKTRYRVMVWRRLLAETLKDVLSRRWTLPQAGGVIVAMRQAPRVWALATQGLDETYPPLQKSLLEDLNEKAPS